jgi:dolichol-phosphate mannosyltransferase
LVDACEQADIVSGSRYLEQMAQERDAPAERRQINREITDELNRRLRLSLTDAFCGFKAYRVCSLARLTLTESGYGMPLELWVQAAHHGLEIVEVAVPLIYLEEKRSFGGQLDDGQSRRRYYDSVLDRAQAAVAAQSDDAKPNDVKSIAKSSRNPCSANFEKC